MEEEEAYAKERGKTFKAPQIPIRVGRVAQAAREAKQEGAWFGLQNRWEEKMGGIPGHTIYSEKDETSGQQSTLDLDNGVVTLLS